VNSANSSPVAGIEYFNFPGAVGQFFDCAAYRAKLSTTACAQRWREAQTVTGHEAYRFDRCRGCPIGAEHAGEKIIRYSFLFDSVMCPRCGVGTTRMIGGTRCVSCYNREREFVRGRNAKGTAPKMAPLHRRVIRFAIDAGPIKTMAVKNSLDTVELIVGALRKTRGRVAFAFNGRSPGLRQWRLF
jgi:hypothetical protein